MANDAPVLTAHDVENARFDQARFAARGYNEDQVDDFLDVVVHTIRALTRTIEAQRKEIDRLKHWRQNSGNLERVAETWEQEARARADSIIAAAQQSAEEVRRAAMTNAQQLTRTNQAAAVAAIVDRLHSLRDGISVELDRLENVLTPGR